MSCGGRATKPPPGWPTGGRERCRSGSQSRRAVPLPPVCYTSDDEETPNEEGLLKSPANNSIQRIALMLSVIPLNSK